MADLPAHLLGSGEAEKSVDLLLCEQLRGLLVRMHDKIDILLGIEADIAGDDGEVEMVRRPESRHCDGLPLRSRIAFTRFVPNSS